MLWIVADALRSDHLGSYGYSRATSPNIDGLAARGVVFEHAIAQASWTKAATASMISSLWPSSHQAVDRGGALPEEVLTAAEIFAADGYQTAGIVSNVNLDSKFGFHQGYHHYEELFQVKRGLPKPSRRKRSIAPFSSGLTDKKDESPFFAFLFYLDPHSPYQPKAPYDTIFSEPMAAGMKEKERQRLEAIQRYDGEIRYLDDQIAIVLRELEMRGLSDSTLIVFTSDHGEEFLDHGRWTHGHSVFDEQLKIPLIFAGPGVPVAARVPQQVQHLDILPTLIDLAGLDGVAGMQGQTLRPTWEDDGADPSDVVLVEQLLSGSKGNVNFKALRSKDWKLVYNLKKEQFFFFHLPLNPYERRNQIKQYPRMAHQYKTKLMRAIDRAVAAQRGLGATAEIDAELDEQLKSLGY